MESWISLYRKFLEWEWYEDINTKCVFIHCLLKANNEDKNWKGKLIKRGQFFTSIQSLSKELRLTSKQVRISLSKLKKTQELGIQGASDGTMITVCKFDHYQDNKKQKGKQRGKRRANGGQQHNNINNIININIDFYETELKNLNGEIYSDYYKQFVNIILGKSKHYDEKIDNVLKLEKQVSYKEFCKLYDKTKEKKEKSLLSSFLLSMANNDKYTKNKKSLYLTLNNWLNKHD